MSNSLAGRLLAPLLLALALVPAASAGATPPPDPTALTLRWYDLTTNAVAAAGQPEQSTQNRIWAISWLAAARVVDDRPDPGFRTAAFATALHDALVALSPSSSGSLDAALASTLASVPPSREKERGISAGQAAAAASLASRSGDGLATAAQVSPPWTPPAPAPGIWQPTPPAFGGAVRSGLPTARPFLLASNDQFRASPPPGLSDPTYLASLSEVRSVGAADSTTRTPAETEVARFIAGASIGFYVQVLRAAIADGGWSVARNARLVAAFNAIQIDQQIAIYEAKYTYTRWRPVTALRAGGESSWTPFLATPSHPEYPSGHTGYAGTAETVLRALVGARPARPIVVSSPTAPGAPRTYADWETLTRETIDGRVWEGVHFRFSDETGADVGRRVAAYDLRHLDRLGLQP